MNQAKQDVSCFHCGELCEEEVLHYDDHDFCCQGCQTVYGLLSETGLVNYYEIDERSPGSTVNSNHANKDFLDLEGVQKQFIEFREGNQNKVTFYLPTMHCAACIWLLERLDRINKGVIRSEVNFLRKELTVFYASDQVSLKSLVLLLEDLGYPPDLQRDKASKKANSGSRSLLLKMGIAGFAFGNIMLFSFPEYLSLDDASLDSFKTLFGYLNLLLSLPVLLYSDVDYIKSAWKSLKVGYLTIDVPIALGIFTLFGRSAFEIISATGSGYFDSFAGLVFFLLVGKWYQSKTYESLAFDRDFRSYFPIAVTKIVDAQEEVLMLEDIQVGDRLKILSGQIIPADSILMKGLASVDYSFVNGESDMVEKREGDYLYAGGRQTASMIEIEVIKEVSQSYLTGLWNQSAFQKEGDKTRVSGLIDRISRFFSIGILSVALLTLVMRLGLSLDEPFNAFTAVLIIACPCALALSMPFALGNVSRTLGKLGFFVKNATTLEVLSNIDTVIFDKTGTLTSNQNIRVEYSGETLSARELICLKSGVSSSSHPLSVAVRNHLNMISTTALESFQEHAGLGIEAVCDGLEIRIGSANFVGAKDAEPGFGQELKSCVFVSIEGAFKGVFLIEKQLRKGVAELVATVKEKNEVHLLSGDNQSELARMSHIFGRDSKMLFNQSPSDKLNYVETLQSQGKHVLILGDGLNDAGALKQADVGIAVADDVFSFSPACDAILQADRLSHLTSFLRYVQRSILIVKLSVAISLLYNLVGLYFAVRGELTPVVAAILMPLSSVTVVGFVSLLTTLYRPRLNV